MQKSSSVRRIAVIMFTDIVGYTSMMDQDEQQALHVLAKNREIHRKNIEKYDGAWLKEIGDGILLSFHSSSNALKCAHQIILDTKKAHYDLCIGLHIGEVLFQDGDVFGSDVNIAARLQSLAVPGSVLFTDRMHDDILNKPELKAIPLGKHILKNVKRPLDLFALDMPGISVPESGDLVHTPTDPNSIANDNGTPWKLIISVTILALAALFMVVWIMNGKLSKRALNTGNRSTTISIATIPFSNIKPSDETDFLGFALADQVINSLTYLKRVIVRPSNTIRKYSNVVVDPQKIKQELDVQYVLMGNYLNIEDSLRINIELIDVENDRVEWTETLIGGLDNIFQLQDLVAQKIIDGLTIQFSSQERNRIVRNAPSNPLAYDYYLRAVAYPKNVKENLIAIDMLKKSIDLDSTFAPAYGELAFRLRNYSTYAIVEDREAALQEAIETYLKALELNPELINALVDLSQLKNELNQKDEAIKLARRVIEINPNIAIGHIALAYVYRYAGMMEEAIKELQTAKEINPLAQNRSAEGINHILIGDYDHAATLFANIKDQGSGFKDSWLGFIHLHMEETEKAKMRLEASIQDDPDGILANWSGAMLSIINQDGKDWHEVLRKMGASVYDPETTFWISTVLIKSGDKQGGIDLFERSVSKGYYPYPGFLKEPWLDPIRDMEQFKNSLMLAKEKHEAFRNKYF